MFILLIITHILFCSVVENDIRCELVEGNIYLLFIDN